MKFIDIEQNTQEWLNFRRDHIGASDCASIMGDNPFKSRMQLWEDKYAVCKPSPYTSKWAQRGHDLEPIAREKINKIAGVTYIPRVAISSDIEWQSASFDGINETVKEIIEIKCPGPKTWDKISKGEIPRQYEWQIQHQLCVSNYDVAGLFIYNGDTDASILVEYRRDEEMITRLLAAETKFYEQNMLRWHPPGPIKNKPTLRLDMEDLLKEAYETQQDMLCSKKKLEDLKEQIKNLCANESVESAYYKFVKTSRKGAVDYSKIPSLEKGDLEKYRNPDSEVWVISLAN